MTKEDPNNGNPEGVVEVPKDTAIAVRMVELTTRPIPTADEILAQAADQTVAADRAEGATAVATRPEVGVPGIVDKEAGAGTTQYRVLVAAAAVVAIVVGALALSARGDSVGTAELAGDNPAEAASELTSRSVGEQAPAVGQDDNADDASSEESEQMAAAEEPSGESDDQGQSTAAADSETGTTITGVVSEVMTDCVSHLIQGADGSVQESATITCDGGSFVVIDGTKIYTASGFTSAEQAFNQHNTDIRPGMTVTVVAAPLDNGALGLKCETCSIEVN